MNELPSTLASILIHKVKRIIAAVVDYGLLVVILMPVTRWVTSLSSDVFIIGSVHLVIVHSAYLWMIYRYKRTPAKYLLGLFIECNSEYRKFRSAIIRSSALYLYQQVFFLYICVMAAELSGGENASPLIEMAKQWDLFTSFSFGLLMMSNSIFYLDVAFFLFTKNSVSLHDYAAGTRVVERSSKS